jgi:hypothetical protein
VEGWHHPQQWRSGCLGCPGKRDTARPSPRPRASAPVCSHQASAPRFVSLTERVEAFCAPGLRAEGGQRGACMVIGVWGAWGAWGACGLLAAWLSAHACRLSTHVQGSQICRSPHAAWHARARPSRLCKQILHGSGLRARPRGACKRARPLTSAGLGTRGE